MTTETPNNRNRRGKGRQFRFGILPRTCLLLWTVIIATLAIFTAVLFPFQKRTLVENLSSTAEVIATSIDQVTALSIISEDYSTVVEHCQNVVDKRPLVEYVVITRRDGFSLIHSDQGWKQDVLLEPWALASDESEHGDFRRSELIGTEVYHYTTPFAISEMDWGWIHIGLSTSKFEADLQSTILRTLLLMFPCLLLGLGASYIFAHRITEPILSLNEATGELATGDFSARVGGHYFGELENLADSFNRMSAHLETSTRKLQSSIKEKELLLREIHHRIKNNMQVLSSLISLQRRSRVNDADREFLLTCHNRVQSMALVHEKLYQSPDLATLDLREYIRSLCTVLLKAHGADEHRQICMQYEMDPLPIGVDTAIPCGLAINELVSNAVTHAFPDRDKGTIRIRLSTQRGAEEFGLTVSDDGIGMSQDWEEVAKDSFGMRLVQMLIEDQLGGEMTVDGTQGTRIDLNFKQTVYSERLHRYGA